MMPPPPPGARPGRQPSGTNGDGEQSPDYDAAQEQVRGPGFGRVAVFQAPQTLRGRPVPTVAPPRAPAAPAGNDDIDSPFLDLFGGAVGGRPAQVALPAGAVPVPSAPAPTTTAPAAPSPAVDATPGSAYAVPPTPGRETAAASAPLVVPAVVGEPLEEPAPAPLPRTPIPMPATATPAAIAADARAPACPRPHRPPSGTAADPPGVTDPEPPQPAAAPPAGDRDRSTDRAAPAPRPGPGRTAPPGPRGPQTEAGRAGTEVQVRRPRPDGRAGHHRDRRAPDLHRRTPSPPGTGCPRCGGPSAPTPNGRRCSPPSPSSTPASPASGCTCAAPPGRSRPTSGRARSTRTPPPRCPTCRAARTGATTSSPPSGTCSRSTTPKGRRTSGSPSPGARSATPSANGSCAPSDADVAEGERRKLGRTVEQFDEVLGAFGMRGRRVTAQELEWLLYRSVALCMSPPGRLSPVADGDWETRRPARPHRADRALPHPVRLDRQARQPDDRRGAARRRPDRRPDGAAGDPGTARAVAALPRAAALADGALLPDRHPRPERLVPQPRTPAADDPLTAARLRRARHRRAARAGAAGPAGAGDRRRDDHRTAGRLGPRARLAPHRRRRRAPARSAWSGPAASSSSTAANCGSRCSTRRTRTGWPASSSPASRSPTPATCGGCRSTCSPPRCPRPPRPSATAAAT